MSVRKSAIGSPCWADLMTTDLTTALDFYTKVLGWTAEETGGYATFRLDDYLVAGAAPTAGEFGIADFWTLYLEVFELEATIERTKRFGGSVTAREIRLADQGVMAVVAEPADSGPIGLWQPDAHSGFGIIDEPGAPSWFELASDDPELTMSFYQDVFGWNFRPEGDAWMARLNGRDVAGLIEATDDVPPGWRIMSGTMSLEDSNARIVELGGRVLAGGSGAVSRAVDPLGGHFGLIELIGD